MRIKRPAPDPAACRAHRQALEDLLRQPTDKQARPCPGCRVPCPCRGSPACTCGCSSACAHAPGQLSSEPDTYPIEPGILPLVYGLSSLRVVFPCWSCEGHPGDSGAFRKRPGVWFFARSLATPGVIAEHLSELRIAGKLACPWHVCVVRWGDDVEPTFAIEPEAPAMDGPGLDRLRRDVRVISADLQTHVKRLAAGIVSALDAVLKTIP
jgi:hypothetical protein